MKERVELAGGFIQENSGVINVKRQFIKQAMPLHISSTFLTADKDPEKVIHTPGSLLPFG